MGFDPVVANAGRLRILTALVQSQRGQEEFVELRRLTCLTDGNLSSHAKRLSVAGYVSIQKQFRAGKPVTHVELTRSGRAALEDHARQLMAAVQPNPPASALVMESSNAPLGAEDWVD